MSHLMTRTPFASSDQEMIVIQPVEELYQFKDLKKH